MKPHRPSDSDLPAISPPSAPDYRRRLLSDDPSAGIVAAAEREFPPGASEAPQGLDRREMMTLMGASIALAGLTGCRRPADPIVPYVTAPELGVPGLTKLYASTLSLGCGAYGVLVTSHEGRPTKIEGNPKHPSSQGATNVWVQASILGLYDPDRSRAPKKRGAAEPAAAGAEAGGAQQSAPAPQHGAATWDDFFGYWQQVGPQGGDGGGFAVLSEGSTSPTLARLRREMLAAYPNARWFVHQPVDEDNAHRGLALATGQELRVVTHLEEARVILTLDADIFSQESEAVALSKGYAARRRKVDEGMNRLYAVESTLTLTGSMADHRVRLQSRRIPVFTAALIDSLREQGLELPLDGGSGAVLPDGVAERLRLIARDLAAYPGKAVVVAGRSQPPEVHALVYAINRALGVVGTLVTLHPLEDVTRSAEGQDLAALVGAIDAGEVSTLLILGGNPAYTSSGDLDFGATLAKVANSVHLSGSFDETSSRCTWHLPLSHDLEAWGDARAADGTLSFVQPLIAPLFPSRTAVELVAQVVRGSEISGYELVRETARELLAGAPEPFEMAWRRGLHDGVVAGSTLEAEEPPLLAGPLAEAFRTAAASSAGEGLEVTYHPSAGPFDGRFANIGWLMEMPEPVTKIVWDNAALISPATAEELGLATGDLVQLRHRGRSIQVPVCRLPGQADGSVALALGYGRTRAGRVGDGVGVNVYPLRDSGARYIDEGLEVVREGGSYQLVQTQEHWTMEGRDLVREGTLEELAAHPDFAQKVDGPPLESLWEEYDYGEGYQWGMSVDLNLCTGCTACVVACQSENNVPVVGREQVRRGREMHWLRVDRYIAGGDTDPTVVFQPIPCMHCENAPCEQVCPVAATVHDAEGLNTMVYNRCIGTRYCANNCPYKVRRFNFFNFTKDSPELLQMAMNPDVTVRSRGVMEKCSYCLQRISAARGKAKEAGRRIADGEVVTACQQVCPTDAIVFGDINDRESQISKTKQSPRTYTLLAELNNKPRTTYLARLRNPNPVWERRSGGAA